MFLYYAVYKPFNVLTQFSDENERETLKDYFTFPPNVYPIGRLDKDSEGLLLLSNDKSLTDKLLNPKNHYEKEYYVQVEGYPSEEAINELARGVLIQGKKTLPAKVKSIEPPDLPERSKPIRFRKNVPTAWLSITLIEGRNRQVRKMTAAVGFPTLRLVRVRINNIHLGSLKPGEFKKLQASDLLK